MEAVSAKGIGKEERRALTTFFKGCVKLGRASRRLFLAQCGDAPGDRTKKAASKFRWPLHIV
jgi:hypothetical protein